MEIFSSKEYVRSRGAYKAQCTFEYFISIFTAAAILFNSTVVSKQKEERK